MPTSDLPLPYVERAVRALEIGYWQWVLATAPPSAEVVDSPWSLHVVVTVRVIAEGLSYHVAGQPGEAANRFATATRRLPETLHSTASCLPRALLVAPSPSRASGERCLCALSCVLWREQQELTDLGRAAHPDRTTPRQQLIAADVEFQRWVGHDPWRLAGPRPTGCPRALGPSRKDMLERASNLRKFAEATAGDLDPGVWDRLGRDVGVRAKSLRLLAAGPVVPWRTGDVAAHVAVRRARLRAWEYARRWIADTEW